MKHPDFILSKNYSLNDLWKKPEYFLHSGFFCFQTHFPQKQKNPSWPLRHVGFFITNKPIHGKQKTALLNQGCLNLSDDKMNIYSSKSCSKNDWGG